MQRLTSIELIDKCWDVDNSQSKETRVCVRLTSDLIDGFDTLGCFVVSRVAKLAPH